MILIVLTQNEFLEEKNYILRIVDLFEAQKDIMESRKKLSVN